MQILFKLTKHRSQLDQQPEAGNLPALPQILMPDNRLGHALRLLHRRPQFALQQSERQVAAVELKGHARGGEVRVRGADVVEQAGEEVGFGGDGEGARGLEVGLHGDAWGRGDGG